MRRVDFEAAAPGLARVAVERLLVPGVVPVGTIRRDGSPRISPVEPFVLDGELWLSMLAKHAGKVPLRGGEQAVTKRSLRLIRRDNGLGLFFAAPFMACLIGQSLWPGKPSTGNTQPKAWANSAWPDMSSPPTSPSTWPRTGRASSYSSGSTSWSPYGWCNSAHPNPRSPRRPDPSWTRNRRSNNTQ